MSGRSGPVALLVWALLWALVGIAKTVALVLLITAADTHWREAGAALLLAFALVALAVRLRAAAP